MAEDAPSTITLRVDSVNQLFNDFDADPLHAADDAAVLGQASIERLIRTLQVRPLHDWQDARIVVQLPPDQITPELVQRLPAALRRYCAVRIAENKLDVSLSRRQHTVGMVTVLIAVLVVMAVAFLLLTTVFAGAPSLFQGLITGGVSVFAWVILWDPLEALLFDWAQPARESRALEHIAQMQVIIQPAPNAAAPDAAGQAVAAQVVTP